VRARIFNVIGPGLDERHVTSWLAMQAAAIDAGLRPPVVRHGPLTTTRDFIPVGEVARALRTLAQQGQAGLVYKLASGREPRVGEIGDLVLSAAGLRERVEFQVAAGRPAGIPRQVASIARLQALGFEPAIAVPDAIRDLVRYYREDVSHAARNGKPPDPH